VPRSMPFHKERGRDERAGVSGRRACRSQTADASQLAAPRATKEIAQDFAQDLPDKEKQVLTATQGSTASAVFETTITTAVWRTKRSWSVIASNDRVVPPELQKAESGCDEGYFDHCRLQSHGNALSPERSRRLN